MAGAAWNVEDDASLCTRGKTCAVLTWGRPELHGLCVFVFHIPKAVPSVMQRRVFFTEFWEWLTVRDTIEWPPLRDQLIKHVYVCFYYSLYFFCVQETHKTMHCWYWGVKKIEIFFGALPSPFFLHVDNGKIKFTSAVEEKNYISMNLVHSGTYMNFPWLQQWWRWNIF